MLVLSRKVDEKILIGNDIEIMVVEIQRGQVRLGIAAPAHVPIHRQEVAEDIRLEELRRTLLHGAESEIEPAVLAMANLGRLTEAEELLDRRRLRTETR